MSRSVASHGHGAQRSDRAGIAGHVAEQTLRALCLLRRFENLDFQDLQHDLLIEGRFVELARVQRLDQIPASTTLRGRW